MPNYNYNPYISPYQQQYQQYAQQYQPQQQYQPVMYQQNTGSGLGKIVDSFENVTVNDVPMDGTPATFVKRDLTEIQVRMWNANGQIVTTSYKPVAMQDAEKPVDTYASLKTDFKELRDFVENGFDRLEKNFGTSKSVRTGKRDGGDAE